MYINDMFQARLWVQIMQELRQGVRLRKVEHVQLSPLEYELTPFEILLEDIRLGRFKLNRVMVRFLNLWIDPLITLIIWATQDFGTYRIRKQLRRRMSESSLLTYTNYESRERLRPSFRPLAPLAGDKNSTGPFVITGTSEI